MPWLPEPMLKKRMPCSWRVVLQRLHHGFCHGVSKGPGLIFGGHDVVDSGDGALGVHHLQLALVQHGKGLGTGDFMDQVQPNK